MILFHKNYKAADLVGKKVRLKELIKSSAALKQTNISDTGTRSLFTPAAPINPPAQNGADEYLSQPLNDCAEAKPFRVGGVIRTA